MEDKRCPKCGETKSISEFYERKKYRWESEKHQSWCKVCTLAHRSEWYYKKGGKEKRALIDKKWRLEHKDEFQRRHKQWNWDSKIRAINAYGGKCECCGETEPKFLAIDHTNGNGNKHRKEIGNQTIYVWLKNNNYPSGFRILCHNCNMAIAFWGVCPHKQKEVL